MTYEIISVLSWSILFPGIVSLFRIKDAAKIFYPVFTVVWLGVVHEAFSEVLIYFGRSNVVSTNIYAFAEFVLWTAFLKSHSEINLKQWMAILCGMAAILILDMAILNPKDFASTFTIVSALLASLWAIFRLNNLLSDPSLSLVKDATFVFCLAIVFQFSYYVLLEIILEYGSALSSQFHEKMMWLFAIFNVIVNLVIAYGILCIPRKKAFLSVL